MFVKQLRIIIITCGLGLSALFYMLFHEQHLPSLTHILADTQWRSSSPIESVVLSLVIMGEESAIEGSQMLKSALMYSSRPLELHIIADDPAIQVLDSRFVLISRPAYDFTVLYYPLNPAQIESRGERARIINPSANWYQLSKMMIHEIIPVDRAIFVDTDMLFLVDPLLLWNLFQEQNSEAIISMPIRQSPSPGPGDLCSCIMLMNLARMRDPSTPFLPSTHFPLSFSNSIAEPAFVEAEKQGIPNPMVPSGHSDFNRSTPWLGDQGLYHAILLHQPQRFQRLRQDWDMTHCYDFFNVSPGKFGANPGDLQTANQQLEQQTYMDEFKLLPLDGAFVPKILHWNCIGESVFVNEYEVMKSPWRAYLEHVTRFKWQWLNRGDGKAATRSTRVKDIEWMDERAKKAGRQTY